MVLIRFFLTNKDKSNVALKPDISSPGALRHQAFGHQPLNGETYRLFLMFRQSCCLVIACAQTTA